MIQVKFFASLRERLGTGSLNFEYAGESSVAEVAQELISRGDKWQLLDDANLLCSVNQTICDRNARVGDGDEIAFFPPVTGG